MTSAPLATIDVDQHIFEPRTMWRDFIDPAARDDALAIEDDERGYAWLTWRGRQLSLADHQIPGRPEPIGALRLALEAGQPAPARYDDLVVREYEDAAARLGALDRFGLDGAVLFPNFGLIWEEMLGDGTGALCANLRAVNRWQAANAVDGGGRLFPVAHVTLRDVDWAVEEVQTLGRAGVRLAMLAPALADGRRLSHPEHDRFWAACADAGVTPVFHVGGFKKPFADAWYETAPDPSEPLLNSVFLWVPPALALADLVLNGTLERFPDLRIGVVELTCGWLPAFLLALDGASDFYTARHGHPHRALARRPSEYVLGQVRVAALAYEQPARIARHYPDLLMMGSDWPHAEGIVEPLHDYEPALAGLDDTTRANVMANNAKFLLRL